MDVNLLPSFLDTVRSQPKGLVLPALTSGFHEAAGSIAGAGEALGRALGIQSLAEGASARRDEQMAAARAASNPAYEGSWSPGGVAYGVLKSIPTLAGTVLGTMAMPEAAVPAGLARLAALAPRAIGGGAGLEAAAAAKAGTELARQAVGGAAAAYPLSVGANMEAAHEGGRAPGAAEGLSALALGVPQAAIGAVAPVGLAQKWSLGGGGNALRRAFGGAAAMGPAMGLQSAAQTASTQLMGDPNKSTGDRMSEIVESFLRGATTGGVIAGGLHALPQRPQASVNASGEAPLMLDAPSIEMPPDTARPTTPDMLGLPSPSAAEIGRPPGFSDDYSSRVFLSGVLDKLPKTVSRDAGLVDLIAKSGAVDTTSLFRTVADHYDGVLADGKTPGKALRALSDMVGYTRDDGAPIDFAAEMQTAQEKYARAVAASERNPTSKAAATRLGRAQEALDLARTQIDRYETAFPDAAEMRQVATDVGRAITAENAVSRAADAEATAINRLTDREDAANRRWLDRLNRRGKQADMFDDLAARDRQEIDAEAAAGEQLRAERDATDAEQAAAATAQKSVEADFASIPDQDGQMSLGDHRVRELGNAEDTLRDVYRSGGRDRIPVGLRKRVDEAFRALDQGETDALGRLDLKHESALREAYRRLAPSEAKADSVVKFGSPDDKAAVRQRAEAQTPEAQAQLDVDGVPSVERVVEKAQDVEQAIRDGDTAARVQEARASLTPDGVERLERRRPSPIELAPPATWVPRALAGDAPLTSHVWSNRDFAVIRHPVDGLAFDHSVFTRNADGSISRVEADPANPMSPASVRAMEKALGDAGVVVKASDEPLDHAMARGADAAFLARGDAVRAEAKLAQSPAMNPFASGRKVAWSRGVPENVARYVRGLDDLLGGEHKIIVTTFDDIRKTGDFAGPLSGLSHALSGQQSLQGAYLRLADDTSAIVVDHKLSPTHMAEIVAHEYGHMIMHTELSRAPQAIRDGIERDYQAHVQRLRDGTIRDLIEGTQTPATAIDMRADVSSGPLRLSDRASRLNDLDSYWLSKDEYMAQQVARWAVSSAKPKTLMDQFFASVGAKLRDVYARLTGRKFLPDATVQKYLDARVEDIASVRAPADGMSAISTPMASRKMSAAEATDTARSFTEKLAGLYRDARGRTPDKLDLTHKARIVGAKFMGLPQIADYVAPKFPQLAPMVDVVRRRAAALDGLARVAFRSMDELNGAFFPGGALSKRAKTAMPVLNKLMADTGYGIDPTVPLDGHVWLTKEQRSDPALAARHAQSVEDLRRLNQMTAGKGGDIFTRMLAFNRATRYAEAGVNIENVGKYLGDADLAKQLRNPLEEYRTRDDLHQNEIATRDFMRDVAKHNIDVLKGYIKAELALGRKGDPTAGTLDLEAARSRVRDREASLAPLQAILALSENIVGSQRPYFHFGRSGDWAVSARLAQTDAAARQRLGDILQQNGFGDFQVFDLPDQDRLFIRLDSAAEAKRLHALLADEGVKRGVVRQDDEHKVRVGLIEEHSVAPAYLRVGEQMLIDKMGRKIEPPGENATPDEKLRYEAQRDLQLSATKMYLDSLPSTSVRKLNQKREMVHGASADMVRSHIWRAHTELQYLARRAYSAEYAQRQGDANAAIKVMSGKGDVDGVSLARTALNEAVSREFDFQRSIADHFVSYLRQATNGFYLAGSVPFITQVTTQPMITVLPVLAKVHPMHESAGALVRNAPRAARVMKEVASLANSLGALDRKALQRAGIKADEIESVMSAVHSGYVGVGGFAHDVSMASRGAAPGKFGHVMRVAHMLGTYAEVASRVMTALAAHQLHTKRFGDVGRSDYVNTVLRDGLGEMGSHAATGVEMMNPMTRVMLQFSRYPAFILSRLYTETMRAAGQNATAAEVKEARRFLLSHAAAVSAFAGTLSLPGMAMLTGAGSIVANKLTGRDDWDLEGSYRDFLRLTLGDTLGQVAAKGVPRALGVDMSRLLGEGNLIPLTNLLADRRKMEDTMKDWAFDTMGAATSTAARLIMGGRDFMDGNLIGAMQKLLPTALRGPADAYVLSQKGWTTSRGMPSPMSAPTPAEIGIRAVGFTPTRKAAMSEAIRANMQLQAAQDRRASVIRDGLTRAILGDDKSGIAKWSDEAQRMAEQHRSVPVLATIGRSVSQKVRDAAQSETLGVPLGVGLRDRPRQDALSGYMMGLR